MSALPFLPKKRVTLATLADAARACRGCPLYARATQTVFGAGPASARVILVGEQPGNDEDLRGAPFVGPAGRVLDKALAAAHIDRRETYVTNVVKHFNWVATTGSRRLHKKPSSREVSACLPWLEEEIVLIKPDVVVLLGATAAQAILGRDFRVTKDRGKLLATRFGARALATVHPSSILRQRTHEDRARETERFVADLAVVAKLIHRRAA
ncbi:MAG TPA: UdgX family uracil-DNA binding protein [Polyangiaceae bacterium]|jgi:DNA polymerase